MIRYIENPKDSIRKLLELISEFSKVAGHKINTQTLLAFLYAKNEKSEREFKKSILFTIAAKRIKNLGSYPSSGRVISLCVSLHIRKAYFFFRTHWLILGSILYSSSKESSKSKFVLYST